MPEIKTIPFEKLLDSRKLKEHFTRLLPFKSEITLQLNKQLVFGSMPRIVLSHTNEQRQIRLGEYLETFIHKDIIETLQVAKYLDFEKMLKLIGFQIGKTVNISELGSHTQLSNETVRKYLMLGEEAFLFKFLPPFFSSKRVSP